MYLWYVCIWGVLCVCAYVHTCECVVCTQACVYVHVYIHICECWSLRKMLVSSSSNLTNFFFLNQGLTDLKALFQGYLCIKLFGSPVTVPLNWHYNHKQTGFLCRCWHSSLGPQTCRAGTFFPASSLTICGLKIFYFICLFCVCVYEKVCCSCESHRTTCRNWFSLLQCGFQGRPQVIKCGSKHLLSHLTGPTW